MSQYQEIAELQIEKSGKEFQPYVVVERNEYGEVIRVSYHEAYWLARQTRSEWAKERKKEKIHVIFLKME